MMLKSTVRRKTKTLMATTGLAVMAGLLMGWHPATTYAAVSQLQAAPQVTFTFDDGLDSALTQAAPTLKKYGYSGTDYIITDCIGKTTVPNTCKADGDVKYMSWAQVKQLHDSFGWNIGSHTKTHPQLATDKLTAAQLTTEIQGSKTALAAQGFDAVDFAAPYGDYNPAVIAEVAKNYKSFRGFADIGYNVYPYNKYLIRVQQVQAGVTVAQVKAYIDAAKANNQWLVLVMHEIRVTPSTDPADYQYATADLDQIAAYVKAQNIKVTDIQGGLAQGTEGLLPNSGFVSGLSNGWTTDVPANVTANAAGNGDMPDPTDSIMMKTGTAPVHLFSPITGVDPTRKYWITGYNNMTARTSGIVSMYVDEYDMYGNWISGKMVATANNMSFKDLSTVYTPTSANVGKIRVQVSVDANSGITTYIDNLQVYPIVTPGTVLNIPTPPVATPSDTNLVSNGQFDNGLTNWTNDAAAQFVLDNASHGATSGATNSVKLTAGATQGHLFSQKVDVDSTKAYSVKAFLNLLTLNTGEVGFYVDEYDANGNWISGKYLTGKRNTGSEDVSMSYTPTNSSVKRASLQVILMSNSGITGFLDDVRWTIPGSGATPPTPPTDPTPPADTNLLTNGSFQSGIANGWTTDDVSYVTADAASHGDTTEEAAHAVKLASDPTKNAHLFSDKVAVTFGKTYTLKSYLNVTSLTSGEVAFYVDEYDAAGNWISGKYLKGVTTTGAQTVNLSYTPTSANVAKASLQTIVTSNSGINAYLDNVRMTADA